MALSLRSRLMASLVGLGVAVAGGMMAWHVVRIDTVLTAAQDRVLRQNYAALMGEIDAESRTARALSLFIANQRAVQEAFAAGDRERLRGQINAAYAAVREQAGVRQIQFHTPPAVSFLRFQQTGTDDDFAGFRMTVVEANRLRHAAAGIEAGANAPAIRAVQPVTLDGRFLGTVEVGLEVAEGFAAGFTRRFGPEVAILLRREDGHERRFGTLKATLASYAALARAAAGEITTAPATSGRPKAVLTGPIRDFAGKTIAVAEIAVDGTPYLEDRATAWRAAALGILAALVASMLAAALLVRRIARPLLRVAESLRRLARGDLEAPVPSRARGDEIGAMAAAVDGLRRDALERRRREEQEPHYAALVAGASDAIVGITLDGIITSWNTAAERLYGFTADEAVGHAAAELIVPEDRRHEFTLHLVRLADGVGIDPIETARQRKDGTRLSVSLSLSPILVDGAVVGASGIARALGPGGAAASVPA